MSGRLPGTTWLSLASAETHVAPTCLIPGGVLKDFTDIQFRKLPSEPVAFLILARLSLHSFEHFHPWCAATFNSDPQGSSSRRETKIAKIVVKLSNARALPRLGADDDQHLGTIRLAGNASTACQASSACGFGGVSR